MEFSMNDALPGHHGPVHTFALAVGTPDLTFHTIQLADPMPTARQILDAAGAHPADEHVVLALLPNGDTEALPLDETFDLRGRGVERVVIFETDRVFRFEVDRREKEWGLATISGHAIKVLAGVDPATHDVYQEVKGNDPLIRDDAFADLSGPGVEHFYTIISQTTEGLATLPPDDRAHLEARGITYEMLSDGAETAIVLRNCPLPAGKLDQERADILVILPGGYPDAVVDMFHCDPWLRLAATGSYAKAADVPRLFAGRNWQRWSRHNNAWRPGVDGIHTVLGRIDRALREAC
jgi:hypothetical protein